MKTMLLAAAAAFALAGGASAAHADTLTFDDLSSDCYGSGFGCPMLANMTFDGTNLTYTSGAYILSFAGGANAHIGDGVNTAKNSYNWHDGPANASGSILTLSRTDGTAFDLTSFDYQSDEGLTATPLAGAALVLGAGNGTATPGFTNVLSVNFYGPGIGNLLDNVVVSASAGAAVPEPATWAMMIGGFGVVGGAMRRRQKTSVRFA